MEPGTIALASAVVFLPLIKLIPGIPSKISTDSGSENDPEALPPKTEGH